MRIIRSRAGFLDLDGVNFNPRTAFPVPAVLQEQVFLWLKEAQTSFLTAINAKTGQPVAKDRVTAYKFLEFLDRLQDVVLQEAAAILIEHPSRSTHGFFTLPFSVKISTTTKMHLKQGLYQPKHHGIPPLNMLYWV